MGSGAGGVGSGAAVGLRRGTGGGVPGVFLGWVTSVNSRHTARAIYYNFIKWATKLAKGRHLLYNIWQMAPFQIFRADKKGVDGKCG